MADKDYKAFIVEGEAREPLIIDNISNVFFTHANFKIITLSAGQNIYMLWKKLKEYCKYYEVVYILFHTGMRISEFCGLTLKDIDLEKRIVNIDHRLQRTSDMRYIIETTKTDAGTKKLPITEDVAQMFQAII